MAILRPSLDRPLHRDGNPYDDGPLPDFTSGLMWIATGIFGLVVQLMPGTGNEHRSLVIGLCAFALLWGSFSLVAGARGWTMPLGLRAAVTRAMMPLVGFAL